MRTNLSEVLRKADNRCAYVYKGTELSCLDGRRNPGERCQMSHKENSLFCGHHDPVRLEQRKIDDRKSAREQIESYIIDKEFDFREMMEEMKGMDPLPGEENGLEKYLLVLWAVSPEESRRPRTINDLAILLERTVTQLSAWLRGPSLKRVTEIERARFYMMSALAIDALVVKRAREGEKWAIQLFLSQSPGGKAGEVVSRKLGDREPKGTKELAQKISLDGPGRSIVQRLKKSTQLPGVRYDITRKSAVRKEDSDGRDFDSE